MQDLVGFLVRHGYVVVGIVAFLDQGGIPFPAFPFLLATGALTRSSPDLDIWTIGVVAVGAAVVSHVVWYEVGRRGKGDVLGFMCRISLEPDLCVRDAHNAFARWGAGAVLLSNFIPGFGVVAQPIAGMMRMPRWRFLGLNLLGAVLWAALPLALGYWLSAEIERVLAAVAQLGTSAGVVLALAFGVYVARKVWRRQLVLRDLRLARITPEELQERLGRNEPTVILDLRHELEFAGDPRSIPGALRMSPDELERRHAEIPRDREVVLYCT
jgi:membrane protein DedA with SNARE-associated domain